MSQRTQRLNSQLQQELMQLLQREMKDPRLGFATVTSVETAPDLSSARVWVSVLGSEEDRAESLRALSAAAPWLRRQLGERLHIRTIPQLLIRRDESIESGDRVLKLLRQIEGEERAGTTDEDGADGASAAEETNGND